MLRKHGGGAWINMRSLFIVPVVTLSKTSEGAFWPKVGRNSRSRQQLFPQSAGTHRSWNSPEDYGVWSDAAVEDFFKSPVSDIFNRCDVHMISQCNPSERRTGPKSAAKSLRPESIQKCSCLLSTTTYVWENMNIGNKKQTCFYSSLFIIYCKF